MNSIFFNNYGRLRSGWRFGVYFGLLFFIGLLLALLAGLMISQENLEHFIKTYPQSAFLMNGAIFSVITIAVGWLCLKGLEDLPFRALGASFTRGWLKDFLLGSSFGILTLCLAAFFGFFLNGLTFEFNQRVSFAVISQNLLFTFVIFLAGATWEEVVFRGYPLQTLFRANLSWLGIVITSLLFGWIHTDNPSANTAPLVMANTTLAGFWLAIAYLKTRNLWFPLGIHWAWNWALASVAGLPVSGITEISPQPLFVGIDTGPTWLTGGHYGIEGGIICTVALAVSTITIWFAPFLKADAELLALTSNENPTRFFSALPSSPSIFNIEKFDDKNTEE